MVAAVVASASAVFKNQDSAVVASVIREFSASLVFDSSLFETRPKCFLFATSLSSSSSFQIKLHLAFVSVPPWSYSTSNTEEEEEEEDNTESKNTAVIHPRRYLFLPPNLASTFVPTSSKGYEIYPSLTVPSLISWFTLLSSSPPPLSIPPFRRRCRSPSSRSYSPESSHPMDGGGKSSWLQ